MTTDLVPDELWEAIGPLLPRHRPSPKGRRPRIPDRAVLGGLIYVLRTGVPWRFLPAQQLGVIWHVDRQLPPSVHRFIELAVEVCADLSRGWQEADAQVGP